ncbi:MAG: hypothetical protein ACRDRS_02255 [Pseudonocardiaceae bacterium]
MIAGEPVALRPGRVADVVLDSGGSGQLAELALAEFLGGHHDHHAAW